MSAAQHEFQRSFSAAVFDPSAPLPVAVRGDRRLCAQPGFAIYRNNAVAGLINVIVQRFPVVHRIAGADSFQAVAHRYIVTEPPRLPILLHYGETFPRFVRSLGSEATLEYLADIAELEWARGRAYHAADADPVTRDAFAALAPDELDSVRFLFHPSVALVQSRFPIVTVWESNRGNDDGSGMISRWCPEYALVARPFLDVEVWRLSAGGHAFVGALIRLMPLSAAVAVAMAADPGFDLAANLAILIESNIVVGFGDLNIA
jgi:Putative DNA-binding domain